MTTLTKPLAVFGDPVDDKALDQIVNCMRDEHAVAGALMADHHLGYSMPIGGVIAYEEAVSPSGVGYDIACGNMAVKTNISTADFYGNGSFTLENVMRSIQQIVSFGIGRKNPTPVDHELFEDHLWVELLHHSPGLRTLAQEQLGTVGSGNHYVDLLSDSDGTIWIAVHFGSRGFGHRTATGFLNLAANKTFAEHGRDSEEPTVISTETDLGQFYIEAMRLAGEYAYAGREYVIGQVLNLLGAEVEFSVHNHHNFAWFEDGKWVVRKGATPLDMTPAFIGGSMGDPSVIVRGIPTFKQEDGHSWNAETGWGVSDIGAIGSAPHGAGRVMSRTKAAGKLRKFFVCLNNRNCETPYRSTEAVEGGKCPSCGIPLSRRRMRDESTAAIDWAMEHARLSERGIYVVGAGADESPGVYKTLETVIGHHSNIQVMHVLEPLGVVMAGSNEFDPYKD